ncbi:MAG: hypothetical protein WD512_19270, partial [Candidatus Paceibacterota bacterium]
MFSAIIFVLTQIEYTTIVLLAVAALIAACIEANGLSHLPATHVRSLPLEATSVVLFICSNGLLMVTAPPAPAVKFILSPAIKFKTDCDELSTELVLNNNGVAVAQLSTQVVVKSSHTQK